MPLRVEHADEMVTVVADPGLHTFIGGVPLDLPALRARYERQVAGSPDPTVTWCNWVIRLDADDALVGFVQATVSRSERHTSAEIAWTVGTPWQRRGIAREAAQGLVDWLRQHNVDELVAHIHPDHAASNAIAAALGLVQGQAREDGEIRWHSPA